MRLVPFRMDGTAFPSPGPEPRPLEPPRAPFAPVDRAPGPLRMRPAVATAIAGRLTCRTPGMGTTDVLTIHATGLPWHDATKTYSQRVASRAARIIGRRLFMACPGRAALTYADDI
jgi:hypothetical protein